MKTFYSLMCFSTLQSFRIVAGLCLILVTSLASSADKPNILVIWGDDIGWYNISAYNLGMMGYHTPNIDRIADEGMLFTDAYGEQSCTAGRSAFITGQSPVRTGLTKVGIPGAKIGLQKEDPTLATLLKSHGYTTGQFGKNHLGDRDEYLPTQHGFDEFFGNLYHLNAEDEPEHPDYPKNPIFQKMFAPRGVIHSYADGKIEDTGPLTKKRMETVDSEFLQASLKFMDKAHNSDTPFFLWFNSTRMHVWTRLSKEWEGKTGQGIYADGLAEHDSHVGALLDKLDELGIAENTIVLYSTDNGAQVYTWPDGGTIPFRGEKNTTWEGGYRVPAIVRWPGKIPADTVSNEIISHLDWLPTLMAAVGDDTVKTSLMQGVRINDHNYKVHLDGYNFLPHILGESPKGPRKNFFYFTDDGDYSAIRTGDWKLMFSEQRAKGQQVWQDPLTVLRIPKIYNLRRDPFERASIDSMDYERWSAEHAFVIYQGIAETQQFMQSFKSFPPRQRPLNFNMSEIMEQFMDRVQ